jgi:uncharacterized membrane protein
MGGIGESDGLGGAAAAASRRPLPVRRIEPARVLRWVRLGWEDLRRCPGPSLLHGLLVAAGGWIVLALAQRYWWLAPGAFSGFVIVGPILCTGLYELSRLLARGQRPGFADVVHAWRRESGPLVRLGLLLFALGTLWVLASALLFTLFVREPLATPQQFLRYAVAGQGDLMFTLWIILGGLGAALVFACTAVSPPLMLGRQVGWRQALLTSVRAVGDNPLPMGLWAAFIMLAIGASLLSGMAGFVITVPLIGHATWHAYKDLVVTDGVPLRHE